MFKKFTDTLSGTLDTVKSYGSSMVIGQTTQDGSTDKAPANKLSLTLPTIGNGSVSAPATTANSPDKPGQKTSLAANTLLGIQNTLGKITGRGDSTNAVVVASQKGHTGRGPTLGNAVITDVTRITDKHVIDDDIRGMAAEDISDFEQYKKLKSAGYLDTHANSNGKSMWGQDEDDTLIDEQFKNLQTNLDTVIGETEKIDELTPVSTKGDKEEKEEKKTPKKKNKHLARCIRCIQDNRVKGGCVDPEEMADAAEDNLVLKKVLNIIFLLIGTLLFLAVVVVIIYTSSVKNKGALEPPSGVDLASAPNKTDYAYEYVPPDYDAEEAEINRYFGNNSNGKANFLKVKNSIDAMAMP